MIPLHDRVQPPHQLGHMSEKRKLSLHSATLARAHDADLHPSPVSLSGQGWHDAPHEWPTGVPETCIPLFSIVPSAEHVLGVLVRLLAYADQAVGAGGVSTEGHFELLQGVFEVVPPAAVGRDGGAVAPSKDHGKLVNFNQPI